MDVLALGVRAPGHGGRAALAAAAAARRRRADRLEERRAPLSSALRRRSESRDQLEVGIVAQPRPRVGRIGPQHLVHLVVVLADLLERPHEIPAYRFSDALAVALKPVGHRLQLAHDLALRSEEHTSELQSPYDLVCRLLLEKKKKKNNSD